MKNENSHAFHFPKGWALSKIFSKGLQLQIKNFFLPEQPMPPYYRNHAQFQNDRDNTISAIN